jgi:hypothetical protein
MRVPKECVPIRCKFLRCPFRLIESVQSSPRILNTLLRRTREWRWLLFKIQFEF